MKTALCLSGRWNEFCDQQWIDRTQDVIPHDKMFTGMWKGYEQEYSADYYFDDPENLYHPVFDTDPYPDDASKLRRDVFPELIHQDQNFFGGSQHSQLKHAYASANWHKQLLIHNEMMKTIPPEYDMIIRSRFDVIVSEIIPWADLLQESYDEVLPIGFNCMNYYGTHGYNELRGMGKETTYYINDALIMHPRECWDTDLVDSLYKDKKLKSAEEGWYQILSEPFKMWHRSYHGGCYLSERWEYVRDVDESLHN